MRSIAHSMHVDDKTIAAALRRPRTSPSAPTIGTSTTKAKASPRGAQRERERVLRANAKRLEAMIAAGDLDPMALVRLSAELRAIHAELAASEAAAAATTEQADAPAEVVERVQRQLQRHVDRQDEAIEAALRDAPAAVALAVRAALGFVVPHDDDEHALDSEGTHG